MPSAPHEVAEFVLGGADGAPDSVVDVSFVDPEGSERTVPAFTSKGQWRVRYSSGVSGVHRFRCQASDGVELESPEGEVEVTSQATTALGGHGPVRVSADGRRLEHADGTPFLWLADTWWHGFVERLPLNDFSEFAAKRVGQGFSAIQIVAGFYPEMEPFRPEGRSKSGWVWHEGYSAPNEAWFDEADERIQVLVANNLLPCIVAMWSFWLRHLDNDVILRHWRELFARWGAYPVVWCLAGEPPFSTRPSEEVVRRAAQAETTEEALAIFLEPSMDEAGRSRWHEIGSAVRALEPFGRPITIHSVPGVLPWEFLDDELVDFWLIQTGHQGTRSLEETAAVINQAVRRDPIKPVINGEACYEGIAGSSWQDAQRFLCWSNLLSGAAGQTYGAHGVWAFNTPDVPGLMSGHAPMWYEAAEFPGAAQMGIARRLLLDLPWSEFEPHPEWLEPHAHAGDWGLPYAAGVKDGPRVMYFPGHAYIRNQFSLLSALRLRDLGQQNWNARLVNPRTGEVQRKVVVEPEPDGTAPVRLDDAESSFPSCLPSWEDWVLVLHPVDS
jgi:hypothetical protein